MKVITYTMPGSDTVFVCLPAMVEAGRLGMTDDQFLALVISKDIPTEAISPTVVDQETLPTHRRFRSAWRQTKGKVGTDLEGARGCVKDELRALRQPLLQALDIESMRNLTDPTALAKVEARKQALRDITKHPKVQNAKTIADLEAIQPAALLPA